MTGVEGIPVLPVGSLVGLLVLGGWVGVDAAALLQIMVSQPLAAGWLAGLLVGEPALGLGTGLLLQLVWMRSLPMGGASLPLTGPAAVVGGVLAGWAGEGARMGALALPPAVPLAVALGTAFLVGEGGRWATRRIRRGRLDLVVRAVTEAEGGNVGGVARANLRGAAAEAALGSGLVLAGLVLGAGLLVVGARLPEADPGWVALPLVGLGLGQIISLAGKRRWAVLWFLAALLILSRRAWM
jgi:mannose/fructose/N-acetylgalactosamine-specific phosphotransferase system component IIC